MKQTARVAVLIALLAGYGLRLYRLGAESLWYDETVSAHLAQEAIPQLIAHTARDIHPPGYYLLLHLWQRLVQPTPAFGLEFLYAWPSVFWGMVLMALIYALGRRLFDGKVATLGVIFAAGHPYHLWYSQEVRMYTLGAALALLVLWLGWNWLERPGSTKSLLGYALAAASGMYVLYYFAFLLIPVNLYVLARAWRQASDSGRHGRMARLLPWLGANLLALALWAPWLPVFVRQALEPPVPPWRVWPGWRVALAESLAALWMGQSFPGGEMGLWFWGVLGGLGVFGVLYGYAKNSSFSPPTGQRAHPGSPLALLLVAIFGPLLLLGLLSIALTPLYHVRYFFVYGAVSPLLLALATRTALPHATSTIHHWPRRLLTLLVATGILALQGWSLLRLWNAPLYRADDHRGATARLAQEWRAGDGILVNAGWTYTAVALYWPQEYTSTDTSLPPPLQRRRLLDTEQESGPSPGLRVPLLTTGNVDGPENLGWGLPESDFYAMPWPAAAEALARASQNHPRLWHYRFYDTVSDPQGRVRRWLASHLRQTLDAPIPGRDFGRLQRFARPTPTCPVPSGPDRSEIVFGQKLALVGVTLHNPPVAGQTLYTTLCWQERRAGENAPLRTSLRLYPAQADLWEPPASQQDEDLIVPPRLSPGVAFPRPLAIPIPVGLPPGPYRLELVVYRGDTGEPLLPDAEEPPPGGRWPLAELDVTLPPEPPSLARPPRAIFDYMELLDAQVGPSTVQVGGTLGAMLGWRPRPNPYRDTYRALLVLVDRTGREAFTWRGPLASPWYPSGAWPAGYPVRGRLSFQIPAELAPGVYIVELGMERASDGRRIPARRWWLPWPSQDTVEIGRIRVE